MASILEPQKAHRLTGHPWLVLTTVMVGTLLIGLDRTVVNLALPKIIGDFGITVSTAAWIATAYIISNAVFVPVFGKLGDLFGNRVIYLWSFIGFIIVSILAGLSWDFGSLVSFRVLQGLVGAAVYPTAMSLIAKSFSNPKARAQALGIWSSSFAVSMVIGPLLGGYLIDNLSWRWIFFINLPVGIVGLAMTLLFLQRDAPGERGTFDWFGAVLLSVAVSSLVLVVDRGRDWGWLSSVSLFCYALTLVFSTLVYRWETRHPHPIIDFNFFRNPVITSVLLVSFISFGGLMGSMLLLPVFAQTFLGYSATQSGYLFLPMALALPVFAPFGAKLANTFNPRYTVSFGMLLSAFGLSLLTHLDPTMTSYDFILPLVIFGAGLGLGLAPLTNAATTTVPLHEVGMSSGLLNLTRNIGGAFGIAIFSTMLVSITNANVLMVAQNSHILGSTPTILAEAAKLITLKASLLSYSTILGYAAMAMVAGAVVAFFFLRTSMHKKEDVPVEMLAEAAAGG